MITWGNNGTAYQQMLDAYERLLKKTARLSDMGLFPNAIFYQYSGQYMSHQNKSELLSGQNLYR